MQGTRVGSLGQEDTLEEERATHSSILAWKIPWAEEAGRLQSLGCRESYTTEGLHVLAVTLPLLKQPVLDIPINCYRNNSNQNITFRFPSSNDWSIIIITN